MDNYFEILGVDENSSDREVKQKYRELIKKYHPDANRGNEEYANEMTAKINTAYDALATEEDRIKYRKVLEGRSGLSRNISIYPSYFIIYKNSAAGMIRGEVYFSDSAVGALYEIITGINLQSFFAAHGNGCSIDFDEFTEIYNSPIVSQNRMQSIDYILHPESAPNENIGIVYKYIRTEIINFYRFYNPMPFDDITRHIQWCKCKFAELIEQQTGRNILDLAGIKKAEYIEFTINDANTSRLSKIKRIIILSLYFAFIIAAIILLVLFGVTVITFVIGAVIIIYIINFLYRLFHR